MSQNIDIETLAEDWGIEPVEVELNKNGHVVLSQEDGPELHIITVHPVDLKQLIEDLQFEFRHWQVLREEGVSS